MFGSPCSTTLSHRPEKSRLRADAAAAFFPPSSVRGLKSFPFSAPFLQPHWCDTRYQSELNFGYTRRGRQRMGPYYTAPRRRSFRRRDVCAHCRVAAGDKQILAKFDTQPFVVDLFKARPRGRKVHGRRIFMAKVGRARLFVESAKRVRITCLSVCTITHFFFKKKWVPATMAFWRSVKT